MASDDRHEEVQKGYDDPTLRFAKELPDLQFAPTTREELREIREELQAQSARGAAVLAASFLDWRITTAIKARLFRWELPKPSGSKPVPIGEMVFGGEERTGELGYIHKCKVAYCMGIVGDAGYRDLERIGQIRNRFAHQLKIHAFTGDAKVTKFCEQLESPELLADNHHLQFGRRIAPPAYGSNEERLRARFMDSVNLLLGNIMQNLAIHEVTWPSARTAFHPGFGWESYW